MKRSEYLRKHDTVQVASNHEEHPNRKGNVLSVYAKSPKGTSEVYDYVLMKDPTNGVWFSVRFEHVVKLENGKPVPYIEEIKEKKKKPKKKALRRKESYPDRVIDWGQWLRYDLVDGTTIVRPHVDITDRYANTDLEVQLAQQKKLEKRWPKHTGWVVRPKYGDENSWIFVGSLEEAENYSIPFEPMFEADEESDEEVAFEPYF